MKRVMILVAALAIASVGTVFANGQKESTGSSSSGPKELSVLWFFDDPSELTFLKSAFSQYTAAHPNVTFKLNTVPYDNLNQKVAQLVAGGTAPDVVKLTDVRPEIAPFVADLSKYLGPDYLSHFIKGVAAAMKRDGKDIGAPLDVTANGIIMNKSLFEKAGVAIPSESKAWTWSTFLSDIKTVRDKTGVKYGLVWDVTPHRWLTYFYENGGQIYSADGKSRVWGTTPAALNSLEGFAKMFKDGIMPLSTWGGTENPRDMFFSGQSVAWMSGSWQVKAMVDGIKNFQWTAGPNPYVTTRSSVLGYKFVSTFSNAKYTATGADFIKFFTSKDMNAKYAVTLTTIPARTDVGTVDYGNAQATSALNNLGHELAISPIAASSDVTNPAMAYVWNPLKENIIDVVVGKKTAQAAVTTVNKVIDDALKSASSK